MAYSSSPSPPPSRHWRYQVFPSFCGVDVRKTFLAHLLRELERKGIQPFIDNAIERSEMIGPELIRAISNSRIAIVVLSKNYASSTWCLNELVEILKCRETIGQTVMTVFYEIDPSDVRNQEGDFGEAFHKACHGKSEEEKHKWRLVLNDVANIAGEHTRQWVDEPSMIEKIAKNVLNKLNSTSSKDFDYLVGMKAHMREMISLLCLESDEVRMVGICGPSGIGKTTIARALYNQLAERFQLSHFMENVKGCYGKPGLDNYGSKLNLQQQLLSEMLAYKSMKIHHLGGIKERFVVMKVLIVLDDVDGAEQLHALARHPSWFGPGSRIIVTSEDKEVVITHGIQNLYEVDFPSQEKAVKIFCQHAFTDMVLRPDFVELAIEAVKLAGYLPSSICELGTILRGKVKKEWVATFSRFRTSLGGKFEDNLRHRKRYDALHNEDKTLFLHIACLLNGEKVSCLKRLLANTGLDVTFGLKSLVDKSLIHISRDNSIGMHYLLRLVGIEAVRNQFAFEPGKRKFLVEAEDIHDMLTFNTVDPCISFLYDFNESLSNHYVLLTNPNYLGFLFQGTGGVIGIYLDTSELSRDLSINDHAFEQLPNLQFLKVIKKEKDKRMRVYLPQSLQDLPPKLRLLHWHSCPLMLMPPRFSPQFLVKLVMKESKLERLWRGTQPLMNLKKIDLGQSKNLSEFPDLSNATNLEQLIFRECESLVMIHSSSLQNLHKLRVLDLSLCRSLEVLPNNVNLESLTKLSLNGCSRLKIFPEISRNIKDLHLKSTAIEEVPSSVQNLSVLNQLMMGDCLELRKVSPSISKLTHLQILEFSGCKNVECFPTEIFYTNHLTHNMRLLLDNIEETSLPTFRPTCNIPTFSGGLVLSGNTFESIPDFVTHIYQLRSLLLFGCKNLKSLPELLPSLEYLYTDGCESLSTIASIFDNPQSILSFVDCTSLDEEAERLIIQETICKYRFLPGKEVPPYFSHQASGCSKTIRLDTRPPCALLRCKVCLVLAGEHDPSDWTWKKSHITCRFRGKHNDGVVRVYGLRDMRNHVLESDHLCVLDLYFVLDEDKDTEEEMICKEVFFEFKCSSHVIIQCGIEILEFCPSLDDSLYYPKAWTYEDEDDDGNHDSDGSCEIGVTDGSEDNYGNTDCESEEDESRSVEKLGTIDKEEWEGCSVKDGTESSAKRRKAN